jgi:hypothetical protein
VGGYSYRLRGVVCAGYVPHIFLALRVNDALTYSLCLEKSDNVCFGIESLKRVFLVILLDLGTMLQKRQVQCYAKGRNAHTYLRQLNYVMALLAKTCAITNVCSD